MYKISYDKLTNSYKYSFKTSNIIATSYCRYLQFILCIQGKIQIKTQKLGTLIWEVNHIQNGCK